MKKYVVMNENIMLPLHRRIVDRLLPCLIVVCICESDLALVKLLMFVTLLAFVLYKEL